MNCPKCNSTDVLVIGRRVWCKDCWYVFKASVGPAHPVAIGSVPDANASAGSLVQCPMCSHQVSPDAVSCPSCGHPFRKESEMTTMKVLRIIFWVVVIGAIVVVIVINWWNTTIASYNHF